jgi:hypothetical protein
MFRSRLASMLLTAGLGLACGCASLSFHPLFGRWETSYPVEGVEGDCCTGAESYPEEGPVLGEGAPVPEYPSAPAPGGVSPVVPQPVMPPLSSPPRLTPQPESAQPTPYTPTRGNWR